MQIGIPARKREILLILLTAIIIAFIVNLLAVIVSTSFYEQYPILFPSLSIVGLLLFSIILYFFILSSAKTDTITITFPLAFSRKKLKFFDLPECTPSVHARVDFDNLPLEGKKHLVLYDKLDKFRGSDFNRFIDHIIQKWVITIIFNNQSTQSEFLEKRPIDQLPEGIKENKNLRSWYKITEEQIFFQVPTEAKIDTYGRNNSFLRIKSKHGQVDVNWHIGNHNMPHYSEVFINLKDLVAPQDYHDYEINLTFNYACSFWRIMSKELREYVDWIEKLEEGFQNSDWRKSKTDRIFFILKKMQNRP